MCRKAILLLATAIACFLVGCDKEGETIITIKVRQGLNVGAEPMPIDGTQVGEEHFSQQVSRSKSPSGTFLVEQQVCVDTPVEIVLVPIGERDGRKNPGGSPSGQQGQAN